MQGRGRGEWGRRAEQDRERVGRGGRRGRGVRDRRRATRAIRWDRVLDWLRSGPLLLGLFLVRHGGCGGRRVVGVVERGFVPQRTL